MKRATLFLFWGLLSACTSYEYEEEVILEVDGSGSLRVSGSSSAFAAFHGIVPTSDSVGEHFQSPSLEDFSVRETMRSQRTFFHVQALFSDWGLVCQHPAFRLRRCRLEFDESERRLELSVPVPEGERPSDMADDALVALRFHFPSTVFEHNAAGGIERGNILSWERTVAEHYRSPPLEIRVRFDDESILTTTMRVLLLAAGTVVTAVTASLILMVRKGRRLLDAEKGIRSPTR